MGAEEVMADKAFRKFRGIDDRTLGNALNNHAAVLQGIARATTMLLRERRLTLVWQAVVTVVVAWTGYVLAFYQQYPWTLGWPGQP